MRWRAIGRPGAGTGHDPCPVSPSPRSLKSGDAAALCPRCGAGAVSALPVAAVLDAHHPGIAAPVAGRPRGHASALAGMAAVEDVEAPAALVAAAHDGLLRYAGRAAGVGLARLSA